MQAQTSHGRMREGKAHGGSGSCIKPSSQAKSLSISSYQLLFSTCVDIKNICDCELESLGCAVEHLNFFFVTSRVLVPIDQPACHSSSSFHSLQSLTFPYEENRRQLPSSVWLVSLTQQSPAPFCYKCRKFPCLSWLKSISLCVCICVCINFIYPFIWQWIPRLIPYQLLRITLR